MRVGDGTLGLPDAAPFDAILVSAGGVAIPGPLLDQLAPGGRLVIPVGNRRSQELLLRTRSMDGNSLREDRLGPVVFVPLLSSKATDPGGANARHRTSLATGCNVHDVRRFPCSRSNVACDIV